MEINLLADIKYEGCYDSNMKNILLIVDRIDNYEIRAISLSFIDNEEKEFKITNLPKYNQTKTYRFNASRNPGTIYLSLDIPEIINCETPIKIILKECSSEKQNISSSLSSTESSNLLKDNQLYNTPPESDLLLENLVEKERIWTTICQSEWLCKDWEECKEGVQKRECLDKNKCFIPTESPRFTKSCGNLCTENWVCKWSNCRDGFTTPTCTDMNNCGTKFTKPQKIPCRKTGTCTPEIKCTPWSKCKINYNFKDLITETINGTKIRLCEDKNNCIEQTYEIKKCTINVDIRAKKKVIQGNLFIEIYNELTNEIIAIIKDQRDSEVSSLDIHF